MTYKAIIVRQVDGTFKAFYSLVGKIERDSKGNLIKDNLLPIDATGKLNDLKHFLMDRYGVSRKEIAVQYMFGNNEKNKEYNRKRKEDHNRRFVERYGFTPTDLDFYRQVQDRTNRLVLELTKFKNLLVNRRKGGSCDELVEKLENCMSSVMSSGIVNEAHSKIVRYNELNTTYEEPSKSTTHALKRMSLPSVRVVGRRSTIGQLT